MNVTLADITAAVRRLDLSGQPVCAHSSLRSFGHVDGGARTVVDAFLVEGCTLMVPTHSYTFSVRPPPDPDQRPERNGTRYSFPPEEPAQRAEPEVASPIFRTDSTEISRDDMGAIPAEVVAMPGRVRGNHPMGSFSAVGPLADALISGQQPLDLFAPLEALAQHGGCLLLMGVTLRRMTFLHLAEKHAGRTTFRRWANGPDGRPMMVEAGGCGAGFPNLAPALEHLERRDHVGSSEWAVYPAPETLRTATNLIRRDPHSTHCGDPACHRCTDAAAGGPILRPLRQP
jgi:aminoglycoside N3'-acetyltransferase